MSERMHPIYPRVPLRSWSVVIRRGKKASLRDVLSALLVDPLEAEDLLEYARRSKKRIRLPEGRFDEFSDRGRVTELLETAAAWVLQQPRASKAMEEMYSVGGHLSQWCACEVATSAVDGFAERFPETASGYPWMSTILQRSKKFIVDRTDGRSLMKLVEDEEYLFMPSFSRMARTSYEDFYVARSTFEQSELGMVWMTSASLEQVAASVFNAAHHVMGAWSYGASAVSCATIAAADRAYYPEPIRRDGPRWDAAYSAANIAVRETLSHACLSFPLRSSSSWKDSGAALRASMAPAVATGALVGAGAMLLAKHV